MIGLIFFLLAASLSIWAANAAEEPNAGPHHPDCPTAYARLVQEVPDFDVKHVKDLIRKHFEAFLEYDEKCFASVSTAKPVTVNFLDNHLIVLLRIIGDEYSIECSGFRIAQDVIVTAQHCRETAPQQLRVRLFSSPYKDLRLIEKIHPNGFPPLTDANDFMIYRIEDPGDDYSADQNDFSKSHLRQQAIAVVAVSTLDFTYILKGDPNRWTEAVRFSRVNSARLFEAKEDGLAARPDHCLLHGSPTYPGMSGAAVVGIWKDENAEGGVKLSIIGIHIRTGRATSRAKITDVNCGNHQMLNMGIFLPKIVLDMVHNQ
ncbi:trypsin-like serine protease [Sinorhizobium fredii]|uniref:trypsin-like serine protease n=1 Tax=Rhizobium fredii TaxID=380 RepID=UPI0035198DCF